MKTTELFAEQVLIGLLALSTVLLILYYPLNLSRFGSPGKTFEQIVTGGFILSTAYLIGMVYDRVADTILQELESHGRLQFALQDFKTVRDGIARYALPCGDPFEDGKYRILVLANSQAADHMNYLRSRIRLTRALAIAMPGLTVSLLLAMEYNKGSRSLWGLVAVSIPVVYTGVLLLKTIKRVRLFERPPKTYDLMGLHTYMTRAYMLLESPLPPKHILRLLLKDEAWIGFSVLCLLALILILSTGSYGHFFLLLAGSLLTLIVGWTWWRISMTFYAFLRDYQRYAPRSE